jgi:hypothetical protein
LIGAAVASGAISIVVLARHHREDSSPSDATIGPGAAGEGSPPPYEPPRV